MHFCVVETNKREEKKTKLHVNLLMLKENNHTESSCGPYQYTITRL